MSRTEINLMKQELDRGQKIGRVISKRIKLYESVDQMLAVTDILINYSKEN